MEQLPMQLQKWGHQRPTLNFSSKFWYRKINKNKPFSYFAELTFWFPSLQFYRSCLFSCWTSESFGTSNMSRYYLNLNSYENYHLKSNKSKKFTIGSKVWIQQKAEEGNKFVHGLAKVHDYIYNLCTNFRRNDSALLLRFSFCTPLAS